MAISNLPTWEEGEISSAGKLNQLRDAIETKFSGAIAGGDIAWPLIAQGNLDMSGFSILAVKRFWNIYNAAEHASFQAAVDAAEASSGGVVFLPPNKEFTVDAQTIEASNIDIVGSGITSVLKITNGATSGQLLSTSSGLSNIGFYNLKVDGDTGTGTAQNGLVFNQVDTLKIHNVTFDDFSGYPLYITNGGVNGNNCFNVEVIGCKFLTSDQHHLFADDVDGMLVHNCYSETSGAGGFQTAAAATAAKALNVTYSKCRVHDSAESGLRIVGASASAHVNHAHAQIIDCQVDTTTGTTQSGIILGTASTVMDKSSIEGCLVTGATGHGYIVTGDRITLAKDRAFGCAQNGFDLAVDEAALSGCMACDNTLIGIDLNASNEVGLSGNVAAGNSGSQWDYSSATAIQIGLGNVGLTEAKSFSMDSAEVLSIASGQIDMTASDPQDAIVVKQGGCPYPVREKTIVTQAGGSPQTLFTVPVGEIWLFRRCIIRTTTAWDGTGFDLDVGINGGDADGFYDGSGASFAGTGVEAADPADQGVLLFSTDALNHVVDATGGAVTIEAVVTAGTGSAGVSKVFLEFIVLKGESEST